MWQAAATNLYILTNNLRGNLMFHFSSTPTGTTCSQPINYPAAGEYFNEFSDNSRKVGISKEQWRLVGV